LPYHKIAENKHVKLGASSKFIEFEAPNNDEKLKIISIFENYKIEATMH
jgi:hypothetical protein